MMLEMTVRTKNRFFLELGDFGIVELLLLNLKRLLKQKHHGEFLHQLTCSPNVRMSPAPRSRLPMREAPSKNERGGLRLRQRGRYQSGQSCVSEESEKRGSKHDTGSSQAKMVLLLRLLHRKVIVPTGAGIVDEGP